MIDRFTSPLLLIHGYPFDASMWDGVISELGDGFPVLAPHVRGFGGEPLGVGPPSLEAMADDIIDFIEAKDLGAVVLAGMSMGGYIALAFAERHPDSLAGFILVNSQARADSDEARSGRKAMIEKVRERGVDAAVEGILPKLLSPRAAAEQELKRKAQRGARLAGADGICNALEAMAARPDRTKALDELYCPIMILHSSDDLIVPASYARQLAEDLKAEYVEIVGAGHAAAIEAPDKTAQALANFHDQCINE